MAFQTFRETYLPHWLASPKLLALSAPALPHTHAHTPVAFHTPVPLPTSILLSGMPSPQASHSDSKGGTFSSREPSLALLFCLWVLAYVIPCTLFLLFFICLAASHPSTSLSQNPISLHELQYENSRLLCRPHFPLPPSPPFHVFTASTAVLRGNGGPIFPHLRFPRIHPGGHSDVECRLYEPQTLPVPGDHTTTFPSSLPEGGSRATSAKVEGPIS